MNIIETLETLAKKREQMREEAIAVIGKGLQEFLIENPEVTKLGWTQSIPTWNDGDTCEFSVGLLFCKLVDIEESTDSDPDYRSSAEIYQLEGTPLNDIVKFADDVEEDDSDEDEDEDEDDDNFDDSWIEVDDLDETSNLKTSTVFNLQKLSDAFQDSYDDLQAAFGDNVKVIVTHEGVTVSEYDSEY